MKKISLCTVLFNAAGLVVFCLPAHSQNTSPEKKDSLIIYTKKEMDHSIKANLEKALKANTNYAVAQLGMSKDSAPYLVVARTNPGMVEIHEQWDDVAIIRSGHGTLKTGYEVAGEKKITNTQPDREWRGGAIESAEVRNLAPGDFIIIPAMIAHQYVPTTGDTLTYWTIKVKRTENDFEKGKK